MVVGVVSLVLHRAGLLNAAWGEERDSWGVPGEVRAPLQHRAGWVLELLSGGDSSQSFPCKQGGNIHILKAHSKPKTTDLPLSF